MPIHLRENQYRGVNAHLHSYLQQRGDWSIFHGEHISDLRGALQDLLPPESGYFVVSEKSLQIARDDLISGETSRSRIVPDVGIYKTGEGLAPSAVPAYPASPGAEVSIVETLSEPENVVGIVIYRAQDDAEGLGAPVTRIELLSPANKPPGSHYRQYIAARVETLQSGINLVEIDYLNERRSPLAVLPDYTRHEPKSYPYVILVSRPYPSLEEGKTAIYGFRVDDPIPVIPIPLAGGEGVLLDLGAVYQQTFNSNYVYGLRIVDYEKLPEGYETYDDEDQRRIKARMEAVSEIQAG
jgi:hypothetical protein